MCHFDFGLCIRYNSEQKGRITDDLRVDSGSPYDRYRDDQPPAGEKRKKGARPRIEIAEDEVVLDHSTAGDAQAGDSPGVEDYYAPSHEGEEPDR
jgi:hypothetical protein